MTTAPDIVIAGNAITDRRQQAIEIMNANRDPIYFMRHYVYVRSQPDVDDGENAPSIVTLLDPWPVQEDLITTLQEELWVIGPKSRKIGFTTIGVGFGLWVQLFHPYTRCHYFSRRDDAAKDMLARHSFSYKRLPDWMRLQIITDNEHVFSILGPKGDVRLVQAYPTTEDTGIEQVADYTLLDEFASIPEPRASRVWAGIEPTIAPNGYCLMISRGKGPQGTFANLLRTAMAYNRSVGRR